MQHLKTYTTLWEAPYAFFGGHKTGPNLVSLPAPTYSRARGMLRGILGKTEMDHVIHEVKILGCRGTTPITVNELSSFPKKSFYTEDQRTVRTYVHLVDVVLTITSSIVVLPSKDPTDNWAKFDQMWVRRVTRGQFNDSAPTMGLKECLADFRFVEPEDNLTPLDINVELGIQPFDKDYNDEKLPWYYFEMRVVRGVVSYPSWAEVKKVGLRRDTVGIK